MKTMLQTTILISASLMIVACSNVGFDQGANGSQQSTPNPSPTPGPTPTPTPTPTPGPTPTPTPTPTPSPQLTTLTKTVSAPIPKVDIVFIVDTSMTNATAVANLSSSLPAFLSNIQNKNIDWQACYITTDVTAANSPAGQAGALLAYAGEPLPWVGSPDGNGWFYSITSANPNVINAQTANLSNVLNLTAQYLKAISPGQGNAQGIGALYKMVQNYRASSGCFRSGATLATILISAKDENGTYGNCNRAGDGLSARGLIAGPNENFCQPVAAYENYQTAYSYITSTLNTKFVFNSIIVQPYDNACLVAQTLPQSQYNTNSTTWWSPAFYGNQYVNMSSLSKGSVSSICTSVGNYASNLSGINQAITQVIDGVTLDCAPVGTPTVVVSPNFATTSTVSGNVISFSPAIPAGSQVSITYQCAQ